MWIKIVWMVLIVVWFEKADLFSFYLDNDEKIGLVVQLLFLLVFGKLVVFYGSQWKYFVN